MYSSSAPDCSSQCLGTYSEKSSLIGKCFSWSWKLRTANDRFFKLLVQIDRRAASREACTACSNKAIRMPMIAITAMSSTNVKPQVAREGAVTDATFRAFPSASRVKVDIGHLVSTTHCVYGSTVFADHAIDSEADAGKCTSSIRSLRTLNRLNIELRQRCEAIGHDGILELRQEPPMSATH